MQLGPSFLDYHDPDLSSSSRLGSQQIPVRRARKIIVNHYLLINSLEQHSCHINSILVHLCATKYLLYSVGTLGYSSNCAEEIAVSQSSLKNISRGEVVWDESRIFYYLWGSLPNDFIAPNSPGFVVGKEVRITPFLWFPSVLLDQLFVVGLPYLPLRELTDVAGGQPGSFLCWFGGREMVLFNIVKSLPGVPVRILASGLQSKGAFFRFIDFIVGLDIVLPLNRLLSATECHV